MGLPPGFLAMLETPAVWEPNAGQDQFGNESWSTPVDIVSFVSSQNRVFGSEDNQGLQEGAEVTSMEIITDAVGIGLKDKITVGGVTLFVQSVDTPKDAVGGDLMHTVTATTESRG